MSVRCIQNSGEYRVSGAVDRVPSSERRDTVSSLRRITRIAPFSTLSKPDSGLILSLAKPRRFPILATLRAQGITHYVMAPLIFSNRIVNAMSWATDAPGGFAEADVELFPDFVTAFVPAVRATAVRPIYGQLRAT